MDVVLLSADSDGVKVALEVMMPVFQVAASGGAATLALIHVIWLSSGTLEAAAFLLAAFAACVTVGVVASRLTETPAASAYHPRGRMAGVIPRLGRRRCALCHYRMSEVSSVWVCVQCDRQGAAVATLQP